MVSVTSAVAGAATVSIEPIDSAPSTASEIAPMTRIVVAARGAVDQRVQAVLRAQLVGRLGAAAGEGGDAPLVRVVDDVGVPGLMGAVEGAEAEVHDAHGAGSAPAPRRSASARRSRRLRGDGHSLKTLRGIASTRSTAIRSAAHATTRPSRTSRARNAESSRRAMSWRAGMDRNARVSSMKPEPR